MIAFLLFGWIFGFVLSRAGATEFDAIHGMFLLEDLHLVGVMGVAIGLSAVGYQLFRRGVLRVRGGSAANLQAKPMKKGLVVGGLLFGAGWALSGTCPGTSLAQIGEGTLSGVLTFAGILVGARLHGWRAARASARAGIRELGKEPVTNAEVWRCPSAPARPGARTAP